jgi:sirohydrochlorin cobaltochelatase
MRLFAELKTAFWHGEPPLSQILSTIAARETYVVPVFKSEGHFTQVIIPREMGLTGFVTERRNAQGSALVRLCPPVGSHPEITKIAGGLAEAAAEANQFDKKQTSVLLVGHGGKESTGSEQVTLRVAESIRNTGVFRSATALFLEQSPLLETWPDAVEDSAVFVPFLIGGGGHETEIPRRLGLEQGATSGTPSGVRVALSEAVGESDQMPRLIVDQATAHDRRHGHSDTAAK